MEKRILNRKKINPSVPVFTGVKYSEKSSLQLFKYNEKECIEDSDYTLTRFNGFDQNEYQYWLNLYGLQDVEKIKTICNNLHIHYLAVQDILDVNQRPKFQEYEKHWVFNIKSITPTNNSLIEQEQLSFIIGNNFLVSFQERKANYFDHIRERLRNNVGIIRNNGSDYLLFLLLESILDNYFKTINEIDLKVEKLEIIDIDTDPSPNTLKTIEFHKRQIHQIKKNIIPIKEFVVKFEKQEFSFMHRKHIKYFYELKDLCLSLIDNCEYIEVRLESSINLFFSVQGHRMNHVMKTLTVVATIFTPLTFITGVYGMNFLNMPELKWKYGYFGAWILMSIVFFGMIIYFKRKKTY